MGKGMNCELYWENKDPRSTVSIIPTSAMTGEGVPDLIYQLLNLSQTIPAVVRSLEVTTDLECSVIEVKNIEGHGTTIDTILKNGCLQEGDTIVLAGQTGPIVTQIRALLTPHPMKEMRVKNEYVHHTKIDVSMGIKISAPELDKAVPGCQLLVLKEGDDVEELKEEVQEGFESILTQDKEATGVFVKASTLGALEALLAFLEEMKIPVFDYDIGEVFAKDVKRTQLMLNKNPEYAIMLCFDVKVNAEAKALADKSGIKIMTDDIMYGLQTKFEAHMKEVREKNKQDVRLDAVFPVILEIDKQCVFRRNDPIILGVKVVDGNLRLGTPICVPEKDFLEIGRIAGIEKEKGKPLEKAKRGDTVCVKIEQTTAQNKINVGNQFDVTHKLYSSISRASIDTLKQHFQDEMKKEDWQLIIAMKQIFKIT